MWGASSGGCNPGESLIWEETMTNRYLKIEHDERVCVIKMNNPPTNAINPEFLKEIYEAVINQSKKRNILCIIITSEIEKFFIAGADIKSMQNMSPGDARNFSKSFNDAMMCLEEQEKILVAAINGHALGGGFELCLACDFRLMAEGAGTLGLPEVTLGLIPGGGGTQRLPRIIGPSKAREMILTGSRIDDRQALSLGVIDKIFSKEQFLKKVVSFSKGLVEGASMAKVIANKSIRLGMMKGYKKAFDWETDCFGEVFSTNDAKEGLSAFLEKRKPEFRGK